MLAAPMPLNVLHISQSDVGGGSAYSARRIHVGLQRRGVCSRMLVGQKLASDPDVRRLKRNVGWRTLDRAVGSPLDALGLQYVLYPSSFGVAGDSWFREADVVQLYNTHGNYFSHTALPFLSRRKPIIWRLSDMWAFTGHVTYSYDCDRWRSGCGSCPYLGEYPALPRDTTALLWRIKRRAYARSKLTIVAPSRWIARLASESPLLGGFDVHHIPTGVDLERFATQDRAAARRRLGLDPERPVVLFSALDLSERRKGGGQLLEALAYLSDVDFQLVSAGTGTVEGAPRPVHALGRLDPADMPTAYAAADVFVLPSLAENLANATLEALACGTPCVCFDVGGVSDAVRHLETGYLAPAPDSRALAEGIRTLLADDELRARLGGAGRELMEREHDADAEAARFAELAGQLT
jgi:glycosyltransferase involved in cell wall biosynthesis